MKFSIGQTVVFTNPDTGARHEFKIKRILRSTQGPEKDLLESEDGFSARGEFCSPRAGT